MELHQVTNILYLSYDGLTDNLGQSQIIPYLNVIAHRGIYVHVISVDKAHSFEKRRFSVNSILHPNITWYSLRYHKSPPLISTLWDLRKMENLADKIIRRYGVSMIHVRSYPPMSLGLRLKKRHKVKLLFDMRGFYADERIEGGIWDIKNPLHSLAFKRIKKAEISYFKESDHVISLTQNGKEHIMNSWGVPNRSISVIPCCADFDHFQLLKDQTLKSEKHFKLVYLGSLGTWYLIAEMLSFFKKLLNLLPTSELHILTSDETSIIDELCIENKIPASSIKCTSAERSELPSILAGMNMSIFFIKESFSKKASSPTKLAELMASGIPVICNSGVGDLDRISELVPGVLALPIEEMNALTEEEIQQHLNALLEVPPARIREASNHLFSLEVGAKRYLGVYSTLLKLDLDVS